MLSYPEPAGLSSLLVAQRDKIRQGTFEAYKLEKILMKKIIALAVAAAVAAPAMADLTIGASARYQMDTGTAGELAASTNRVLLSASGSSTAESGLYVSAGATWQIKDGATNSVDGDNAITIGNEAANVVFGSFEPAGAFSSGADAFQNSVASNGGYEGGLRARSMQNLGLNVTAVEGLTLQISTDVDTQDDVRLVVGTTLGGVSVSAGLASSDNADEDGYSITAGTTLGGVALNASYGENEEEDSSMNINASYMGFSLAYQKDEVVVATGTEAVGEEAELYGAYAIANAGGVEGFNVTVGFGTTDTGADDKYGVRFDYAF